MCSPDREYGTLSRTIVRFSWVTRAPVKEGSAYIESGEQHTTFEDQAIGVVRFDKPSEEPSSA